MHTEQKKNKQSQKTVTLTGPEKINVTLNNNQVWAWNKLKSEGKEKELLALSESKFKKEVNAKVREIKSKEVTLDNKETVNLNNNQVAAWNKFSKKDQDALKGKTENDFIQAVKAKAREMTSEKVTIDNGKKVTLKHNQAWAWNKFTTDEQNTLKGKTEDDFIKEVNAKVGEIKSKEVILDNGNTITLNNIQVTAWNKFSKKDQDALKEKTENDFIQAVKAKVIEIRRKKVMLGNGETVILNNNQVWAWNKFSKEEQDELKGKTENDFI